MWGIDEWGVAGQWLSGVATFTAAAVSLRIAHKGSKPNIKVFVNYSVIGGEGIEPIQAVSVKAVNVGSVPVKLDGSEVLMNKSEQKLVFIKQHMRKLPTILNMGEAVEYYIYADDLKRSLKNVNKEGNQKLVFVFYDASNKKYKKKFLFEV
ncbi:hypothetical protein [Bacillus pumilus]|uniref:hypothetical protein n=1 Tax=Bacillus pumilus TaxID=1408 RepID=UPI003CFFA389